jgi:lipoprotein signal peptidase
MTTTLRRTITALSLILISFTAFAQQAERQIKGKLVDETNTPVDYATISVVNAADSLLETGPLK